MKHSTKSTITLVNVILDYCIVMLTLAAAALWASRRFFVLTLCLPLALAAISGCTAQVSLWRVDKVHQEETMEDKPWYCAYLNCESTKAGVK